MSLATLRFETHAEQVSALRIIAEAWDSRSEAGSRATQQQEIQFLGRFAIFARRHRHSESAAEIGVLWKRFVTEHHARYPGSGQ